MYDVITSVRYFCVLCFVIVVLVCGIYSVFFFFFQAEDGIRDLVRSRGLGDVYKRQFYYLPLITLIFYSVYFNLSI